MPGEVPFVHRLLPRVLAAVSVLAGAAGAAAWAERTWLPREDEVARGLRVGGVKVAAGARPRDVAEAAARRVLERRFELRYAGETLVEASLAELGAEIDVASLAAAIGRVAHDDELVARLDAALEARRGHVDVPVHVSLPAEPLALRIERFKEEHDVRPLPAKLDFATQTATPHVPGHYVDPYLALAALDRALASGEAVVDVASFELEPRASSAAVAKIDTTQIVSKYETRFGYVGGQANRGQNVMRAASLMDGVVLMPGDIVSFNANVGPRTHENGFFSAPEIYKGEMRDGIGGGTCQVSGTLHAAAFFGGIDIVERSNHSRPSGYIGIGLDATVVYPVVDLRLRNPFSFPIVIHAIVDKGTLRFELLGSEHPATVELATDTVGVAAFKRKVEEAAWLPAGQDQAQAEGESRHLDPQDPPHPSEGRTGARRGDDRRLPADVRDLHGPARHRRRHRPAPSARSDGRRLKRCPEIATGGSAKTKRAQRALDRASGSGVWGR